MISCWYGGWGGSLDAADCGMCFDVVCSCKNSLRTLVVWSFEEDLVVVAAEMNRGNLQVARHQWM